MKQNDLQIVPMGAEHIDAIAALERECFSDPWPAEILRAELSNPLSLWRVARCRDATVGYVGSQSVPDEADMMNLAVAPSFRHLGIGRALTEALCDALAKNGIRWLTLEVRVSNAPALGLYEKLGFVPVGRRPRYYFHPAEDALILKKELKSCNEDTGD